MEEIIERLINNCQIKDGYIGMTVEDLVRIYMLGYLKGTTDAIQSAVGKGATTEE